VADCASGNRQLTARQYSIFHKQNDHLGRRTITGSIGGSVFWECFCFADACPLHQRVAEMSTIPGRASGRRAYIVFVDEAGFMLAPLLRRTWAPRGHTPVVKVSAPHERISAIGAIAISPRRTRFSFLFHLLDDNANFRGHSLVRFIEDVRRRLRGPITLVWDSIPIHQSAPVKRYLGLHRNIVVEPFPPYAPELNPVDNVWSYVKYGRLANLCPSNLAELRGRVTGELSRLQKRRDLLRAFFDRTGLTI
jgi:transposase